MDDGIVHPQSDQRNADDYTGAVCLLLPRGGCTIIDADLFDFVAQWDWRIELHAKGAYRHVVRRGRYAIPMSRVVLGDYTSPVIDHINHNPQDNRRANLRGCTQRGNVCNRRGSRNSTSRYKGVSWSAERKKWVAMSGTQHKRVNLGRFDSEIDAARAYNEYAKKHFGPFAYLNPV